MWREEEDEICFLEDGLDVPGWALAVLVGAMAGIFAGAFILIAILG